MDITLRLKHGIHTFFLFVDPLTPFSKITDDLLKVIRDRYPTGLETSISPPKTTSIPDDAQISYAVLKAPSDPSQGWRNLRASATDTPVEKGLKDGCIVAFAFQDADSEGDAVFEVEWPRDDDPDEQQG